MPQAPPPPPTSNLEVLNTPPPPPPPGNPEVLDTPPLPPPGSPERANTNGSSVAVPGVEVPAISTDEPKTPEEFLLEQGDFSKAFETGKDVFVTEYKLRSENQNRDPFNSVNAQRKVASEVTTNILEFLEPKMPLESFPINQLKLTGVLWRTASPKASFLDPNGSAHIARKNERIGVNKGYIAAIRERGSDRY